MEFFKHIGFNKKYAKETSKTKWVKEHEHLGTHEFLSEEYDKIVPPKENKKASSEKDKAE